MAAGILPLDIWREVVQWTREPKAIAALRATCRALRNLTAEVPLTLDFEGRLSAKFASVLPNVREIRGWIAVHQLREFYRLAMLRELRGAWFDLTPLQLPMFSPVGRETVTVANLMRRFLAQHRDRDWARCYFVFFFGRSVRDPIVLLGFGGGWLHIEYGRNFIPHRRVDDLYQTLGQLVRPTRVVTNYAWTGARVWQTAFPSLRELYLCLPGGRATIGGARTSRAADVSTRLERVVGDTDDVAAIAVADALVLLHAHDTLERLVVYPGSEVSQTLRIITAAVRAFVRAFPPAQDKPVLLDVPFPAGDLADMRAIFPNGAAGALLAGSTERATRSVVRELLQYPWTPRAILFAPAEHVIPAAGDEDAFAGIFVVNMRDLRRDLAWSPTTSERWDMRQVFTPERGLPL